MEWCTIKNMRAALVQTACLVYTTLLLKTAHEAGDPHAVTATHGTCMQIQATAAAISDHAGGGR